MPTQKAKRRAATQKRQGKSASTQAGEYVREEMRHQKQGRHKNPKQAIAIGLSKARQEGVDVPPPKKKSAKKSSAGRSTAKKGSAKKKGATKKKTSAKKKSSKR